MNNTDLDDFVRGLQIVMQQRGIKPAPLSLAAGLGISAVRDLFRKSSSPKVSTAYALSKTLGTTVDDLIMLGLGERATPFAIKSVAVAGRIGAGAQVDLVDDFSKGDGLYLVEAPAEMSPHGIVAVEVTGDSMEPFYQEGGIIFYSREANGVPSEAINKICVAECEQGKVWLKQIKPGSQPGLFHLLSLNMTSDPMYDRRVKWAAPVRHYLPPDLVRKVV